MRPLSVGVIFKQFKNTYPNLGRTSVYHHQEGVGSIRLYFEDGSMMIYDYSKNRIVRVIEPEPDYLDEDYECVIVDRRTEDEYKEDVGRNIRWEMRRSKITQKELSLLTSIPIRTLNRYVKGEQIPSMYIANRIARALNCPVEHLYRM